MSDCVDVDLLCMHKNQPSNPMEQNLCLCFVRGWEMEALSNKFCGVLEEKNFKKNRFWIWRLHERRVCMREIKFWCTLFWSKGLKSERVTSQNWHPTADKIETVWCKHIGSARVSVRHAILTHPFKFKRWIGCIISLHYWSGTWSGSADLSWVHLSLPLSLFRQKLVRKKTAISKTKVRENSQSNYM